MKRALAILAYLIASSLILIYSAVSLVRLCAWIAQANCDGIDTMGAEASLLLASIAWTACAVILGIVLTNTLRGGDHDR